MRRSCGICCCRGCWPFHLSRCHCRGLLLPAPQRPRCSGNNVKGQPQTTIGQRGDGGMLATLMMTRAQLDAAAEIPKQIIIQEPGVDGPGKERQAVAGGKGGLGLVKRHATGVNRQRSRWMQVDADPRAHVAVVAAGCCCCCRYK